MKVILGVRVEQHIKEKLVEKACLEDRTVSYLVNKILEQHFSKSRRIK